MTLQQLRYIVAVAECGSITEAAEKLFITQPSITLAMKNIEEELGVTAFIRSKRGIELTKDGEALLCYARQVLEQENLMMDYFLGKSCHKAVFSVSSQHFQFVSQAFSELIKHYDNNEYTFALRETQTKEIIEDVSSGRSELGILHLGKTNENILIKMFAESGLSHEVILTMKPSVIISSKHPLAEEKLISIEKLKDYPYIIYEQGGNSFYYAEEYLDRTKVPKNIIVRDRATLYSFISNLNGFSVGTGYTYNEIDEDIIIPKPFDYKDNLRIIVLRKRGVMLSEYAEFLLNSFKRICDDTAYNYLFNMAKDMLE